jgi:hypothetical protein
VSDTPPPQGIWRQARFDATWLPGLGGSSLQINDLEACTTLAFPLVDGWAPLTLSPGVGVHFWDGPAAGHFPPAPLLPSHLADVYLDVGWRPQLARWLFLDLVGTVGLYSDLEQLHSEAFQLRGRAVAIVAFSPQLQLAGGALYVNRIMTRVLPAGGVIWNPNEDTRLFCVFPQPKLARRLTRVGDTEWWAYLAGEFGGGKWSFARDGEHADLVDYTDWRVLLGLEWLRSPGLKGHVEVGYVFNRTVRFKGNTSDHPDYRPENTCLLRVGLSF